VLNAVVATDPVEEHFGGRESKSVREDLSVEFLRNVKSR
jgi:hypothetical protein